MKLFLFGGAPSYNGHAEVEPLLKLIETTIHKIGVKQILHIPFARTVTLEPEWSGDRFHRYINIDGLEYLNAANEQDLAQIKSPLIFISGGGDRRNLFEKIKASPLLLDLIKKADFIIGESAGSKILGAYFYDKEMQLVEGLGILPDAMIEPHYIEKNRQALLANEVKEANVSYGIGIDSGVGIEIDVDKFPAYTTIGDGIVEIKTNPNRK